MNHKVGGSRDRRWNQDDIFEDKFCRGMGNIHLREKDHCCSRTCSDRTSEGKEVNGRGELLTKEGYTYEVRFERSLDLTPINLLSASGPASTVQPSVRWKLLPPSHKYCNKGQFRSTSLVTLTVGVTE